MVTLSLAMFQFPVSYPWWTTQEYWVVAVATSILFFGSVLAHELSHGLVAIRNNIPVRGITLFVFGGVAQITREANRPSLEAAIAAVGPVSSVVIAGIFWALARIFEPLSPHVAALCDWLARINLILAIFNMVPGFPLDGGRVLRAVIWSLSGNHQMSTRIATLAGRVVAILLIGLGILFIVRLGVVTGLWFILIGWFLESAASNSYQQFRLRRSLEGFRVRDIMSREVPQISSELTVRELVDKLVLASGQHFFVVVSGEGLQGVVTIRQIRQVPKARWDDTPISAVMVPSAQVHQAHPEDEAFKALEEMEERGTGDMPVIEDGRVVGTFGRENLIRLLNTRNELGV